MRGGVLATRATQRLAGAQCQGDAGVRRAGPFAAGRGDLRLCAFACRLDCPCIRGCVGLWAHRGARAWTGTGTAGLQRAGPRAARAAVP